MNYRIFIVALVFSVCFCAQPVVAKDVVKINTGQSTRDIRSQYSFALLYEALNQTVDEYGEYEVQIIGLSLPNFRKMQQISEGETINAGMALTTIEWEQKTIPIRVPLRRGILNYRLLMIHKDNLNQFSSVGSDLGLKRYKVGLRRNWATWEIMREMQFEVVNVFGYEAVFGMLEKQRFDFVPRGPHEIYDELRIRQDEFPSLRVEPNIALYIPAPFYIFVSPKNPRLAKRLELGLNKLVDNGFLPSLFDEYYAHFLRQSNMAERKVIHLGNPFLPELTPLEDKRLWLDWDDYRN